MPNDFPAVFAALRGVLARQAAAMNATADTPREYTLMTRKPSPMKQHKGAGMYFGSVRLGKAYVSFHLFPLYTTPQLAKEIAPALKKKMQGKSCFNFKTVPDSEMLAALSALTQAGEDDFRSRDWL